MKNIILKSLSLIFWSNVVDGSSFNSSYNSYYILMKDKLIPKIDEKIEDKLSSLITYNQQKIIFLGCDFKELKGSKEEINNELRTKKFFENYNDELIKYHLSLINFIKVYTNDRNSASDSCNRDDYMNIIKLDNNELMITYKNKLVFYRSLSKQKERNINKYYSNVKCVDQAYPNICYYKNMTILDVYNAMSLEPKNIFRDKIKLGKDFSVFYIDKSVNIDYKWSGKNKLKITQKFPGAAILYTFIYQGNTTKLMTTYYME
jgi:hypothetical protein